MRFAAIYSGRNLADSRLIALTTSPSAIEAVASAILREGGQLPPDDPALRDLEAGRRKALRKIAAGEPL